ncbi:DUF454 family protein [Konateibacter massiliensis]|uniref:DUF454 family protein n=1 Tax=Konateibacter massiliensis TaxID=2002841 RepID=UPI000C153CF2|nr:DUF454 family protein [Konateibacter massiliensis]
MKKILNGICVGLAFLCLGIGSIGIVLPLLPTTPFLLLALILFAKGSERFHKWFKGTQLYKRYLETYVGTKAMPLRTKYQVLGMISVLFTFGFIFSPVLWARIVIVVVWIGHFYFFLVRMKTVEEEDEKKKKTSKKSLKGAWKKIFSSLFIGCFVVYLLCGGWSNEDRESLPLAKAETTLADGVYTVPISLWHATNDAASMGNGALNQTGKLIVESGKASLYLNLKSFSMYGLTGNLIQFDLLEDITYNEYKYPDSYKLVASTVISTYATVDEYNAANAADVNCAGKLYPKVVSVPVTINTEYTWAHVYVPIMGSLGFGDQLCRIKVDYSAVSPITEEEAALWSEYETSDVSENTGEDTDTDTDGNTDENSGGDTDSGNGGSTTSPLDKDNLSNGKYNVYVDLWHATANQASMGNAAMNHTALLTVKDGVYTLDFTTHPMTVGTITACLQSVQIEQADGSYVYAQITASNNTVDGVAMPSAFSFTLPSKGEYTNVKIDPKVAVMGTDPLPARFKISWDTLTAVADDAVVEENTETSTEGLNSPAVDLTDKTTGIRIKADANILISGVTMKVTEISSGSSTYTTVAALLSEIATEFAAYDITLYSSAGTAVEPSGMVTVYIPVPSSYDTSLTGVYRIKDSAKSKLTTTIEDEYAVFETSSFSKFAVVDTGSVTKSTLPTTKSTGTLSKKTTSSSISAAKTSVSGGTGTALQNTEEQNAAKESDSPVTVLVQQNGLQMNEALTLLLVGITIAGSMIIMLFIIGFILTDSLVRRRK